jgi:lipid-A-disaccharide synthase
VSHVFLVAAEDSGDAFGADVIDALRAADPPSGSPESVASACASAGAHTDVDMSGLAVLGLVEGLKAYGRVKQAVEDVADAIAQSRSRTASCLIDSWGFMWRVARALKLRGVSAPSVSS